MNNWAPILYRGFWDVPRVFLVNWRDQTILFDCLFDESIEDYPDFYRVFIVPSFTAEELAGSWADLYEKAIKEIGVVPVQKVVFDPTRRKSIDATLLNELLKPHESRGAATS
jgi:hypothetical protein